MESRQCRQGQEVGKQEGDKGEPAPEIRTAGYQSFADRAPDMIYFASLPRERIAACPPLPTAPSSGGG